MKKIVLFLTLSLLSFLSIAQQPGSLDSTFSNDGISVIPSPFGRNGSVYDIALQIDGKILVAGRESQPQTLYQTNFLIIRLMPNGIIDSTFGLYGRASAVFSSGLTSINSIDIQPDGKILAVGNRVNTPISIAVARFKTNGVLDSTFSSDGLLVYNPGVTGSNGRDVAIQSDGKIIIGGIAGNGPASDIALVRLTPNGIIDNSFNIVKDFGLRYNLLKAIAIQPDGKVITAGYSYNGNGMTDWKYEVVRFNPSGTLDTTFNHTGLVNTDFGTGYAEGDAMVLQSDGKILVVGSANAPNGKTGFSIARYNSNGSLDNSFSLDGKIITPVGSKNIYASGIGIQSDGKIVVSGTSVSPSEFCILRYLSNGELDSTFGNGGVILTGTSLIAICQKNQIDDKIIVGGTVGGSTNNMCIARYLSGLNIGILNLSKVKLKPLLYPNPIKQNEILEYNLPEDEVVSIYLFDSNGRVLRIFLDNEKQESGKHKINLNFPDDLSNGTYLIRIFSLNGSETVKVIK